MADNQENDQPPPPAPPNLPPPTPTPPRTEPEDPPAAASSGPQNPPVSQRGTSPNSPAFSRQPPVPSRTSTCRNLFQDDNGGNGDGDSKKSSFPAAAADHGDPMGGGEETGSVFVGAEPGLNDTLFDIPDIEINMDDIPSMLNESEFTAEEQAHNPPLDNAINLQPVQSENSAGSFPQSNFAIFDNLQDVAQLNLQNEQQGLHLNQLVSPPPPGSGPQNQPMGPPTTSTGPPYQSAARPPRPPPNSYRGYALPMPDHLAGPCKASSTVYQFQPQGLVLVQTPSRRNVGQSSGSQGVPNWKPLQQSMQREFGTEGQQLQAQLNQEGGGIVHLNPFLNNPPLPRQGDDGDEEEDVAETRRGDPGKEPNPKCRKMD